MYFFQLEFEFSDGGYGLVQERTNFVLLVNVNRNLNAPQWLSTPANPTSISENLLLADPVLTLQISDLDENVRHLLLIAFYCNK